MARAWVTFGVLLLLAAPPVLAAQADTLTEARELFLEVERAARLAPEAQAARLPRLYRDVCAALDEPRFIAAFAWTGFSTAPEPGQTPEETARRLEHPGGWPTLAEAGRRRCRELLSRHRERVELLASEDLKSDSRTARERALRVAGQLNLVGLYDEAVAAFRGQDAGVAAYTLRDLDDPRAIPVLIRGSPEAPTAHFEILRSLQRNRPAHPLLTELLRSGDAKVRWQAAYALAESRDPALVPVIERLSRDLSAEVRRQAGHMGTLLNEADYRKARRTMLRLLRDPDLAVRADTAFGMAWRKDAACAPALLELIRQEETLENWRQSNIVQAIHTLTGSYFGLTPGKASPPDVRRRALENFSAWIKQHAGK